MLRHSVVSALCNMKETCCVKETWAIALQAPLSVQLSRQDYWSGLPFSTPEDLLDPGIKLPSLVFPALAGRFFTIEPLGNPYAFVDLRTHSGKFLPLD